MMRKHISRDSVSGSAAVLSNLPGLLTLPLAAVLVVLILAIAGCSDSSSKEGGKGVEPVAGKEEKKTDLPGQAPAVSQAPSGAASQPANGETGAGQSSDNGSGGDSGEQAKPIDETFHKFRISTRPDAELEGYSDLKITYSGKIAAEPEDEPFRETSFEKPGGDFPASGCETLKLEVFTGGANCCFGYYIMTSCPDGDYLGYIEPFDGMMSKSSLPGAFSVDEPYFIYYGVEDGTVSLDLSRVESPRPQRLLVFENGAWRADKVGEFAQHYRSLSEKAGDGFDKGAPAAAILKAYYAYMAGDSKEQVLGLLKKELPAEYAVLSEAIFADIAGAAGNLDLVEMLPIR